MQLDGLSKDAPNAQQLLGRVTQLESVCTSLSQSLSALDQSKADASALDSERSRIDSSIEALCGMVDRVQGPFSPK